ncbi:MAG: hypothetical protein M5U14_05690 [Acidimicrobiia bacterium]|nr:hypothetical protein [Acidimicrobiia bacterium]
MQPFERLRHLARWADTDDTDLVEEAADCLGGFRDDPAGLVVACRRLVAHHPVNGRLWWLCARALCAPDPADAAAEACRLLRTDPTPTRLAEALPFPPEDPVLVLGAAEVVEATGAIRPDLHLLAVRGCGRPARVARPVSEAEGLASSPGHVLVGVHALGPDGAVVPAGAVGLARAAREVPAPVWFVAGAGRTLPARLFDVLGARLGDEPAVDVVPLDVADRVVGPKGPQHPRDAARRPDCPVAPELLR